LCKDIHQSKVTGFNPGIMGEGEREGG